MKKMVIIAMLMTALVSENILARHVYHDASWGERYPGQGDWVWQEGGPSGWGYYNPDYDDWIYYKEGRGWYYPSDGGWYDEPYFGVDVGANIGPVGAGVRVGPGVGVGVSTPFGGIGIGF